jgi:molecular chaperone GrpE (heat shock protein)
MTSNRLVVEVVTRLIRRIETLETQQHTVHDGLTDVDKQVRRLAKELYKTNLMNEASGSSADDAAASRDDIAELLQQLQQETTTAQQQAIREARLDVMQAFIPVIDSIEAGLRSGVRQLRQVKQTAPDAAHILYGWLSGQRLLRERLLNLLEKEGIEPINTVDCPFDPYQHVATKIVSRSDKPANTVIRIERPGYRQGDDVLRFAEVILNKLD